MDRTEQEYIGRCKQLIGEKFHFGNGHGELRQRDLEYLADSIEEKSGIKLSLSTLKRLWKKDYLVKLFRQCAGCASIKLYDRHHPTTLNIVSRLRY